MRIFLLFVGNVGRFLAEWSDEQLDEHEMDIVSQMRKSWVPPKLAVK